MMAEVVRHRWTTAFLCCLLAWWHEQLFLNLVELTYRTAVTESSFLMQLVSSHIVFWPSPCVVHDGWTCMCYFLVVLALHCHLFLDLALHSLQSLSLLWATSDCRFHNCSLPCVLGVLLEAREEREDLGKEWGNGKVGRKQKQISCHFFPYSTLPFTVSMQYRLALFVGCIPGKDFSNGLLINPWLSHESLLQLSKPGKIGILSCVWWTAWWGHMLVIALHMAEPERDSGQGLILPMAQVGEEWTKMGQVCVIPRVLCFNIHRNFSWPSKTKQKGNQNKWSVFSGCRWTSSPDVRGGADE